MTMILFNSSLNERAGHILKPVQKKIEDRHTYKPGLLT